MRKLRNLRQLTVKLFPKRKVVEINNVKIIKNHNNVMYFTDLLFLKESSEIKWETFAKPISLIFGPCKRLLVVVPSLT